MADKGADPEVLMQQLTLLMEHPKVFADRGQEIASLARRAAIELETPFEAFQRLAYSPLPLVVARIGQQQGIFKTLIESHEPVNLATLADKSHVPPTFLVPLLEYMATHSMIDVVLSEGYKPIMLSNALMSPLFTDGVTHFHDNCLPAFAALRTVISDPENPRTAFRVGHHSPVELYEWLETRPFQQGAFHRFMEYLFASLPTWLDVVDFQAEYAQGTTADSVLFVDVGGGSGQQCLALRKKYPNMPGVVCLQDRPAVLNMAMTGDDVERMDHDFFLEQPVKDARAYYFRQIFHNYDDAASLRILKAHIQAMSALSVLLIDDKVLDDAPAHEYIAALNIAMIAMFKAFERKEGQWKRLLNEAGLKIKEIRKFTQFGDSIIIAIKS